MAADPLTPGSGNLRRGCPLPTVANSQVTGCAKEQRNVQVPRLVPRSTGGGPIQADGKGGPVPGLRRLSG